MNTMHWVLFIGYFAGSFAVTSTWFWYNVVVPIGQKIGFYGEL